MRKALVLVVAAATVAAASAPALAADTTLTVNLSGGALSISAPATASLAGSAAAGTLITGTLGVTDTTVTDATGSLRGWNVTAVTDGDLETLSTANADKIALPAVGSPLTILGGAVAAGTGSLLSGVALGAGGGLSTAPVTLVTATAGFGGGTYSFRPTLALTVPPNTKAHADYTVKITQSVS